MKENSLLPHINDMHFINELVDVRKNNNKIHTLKSTFGDIFP